MMEFRFAVPWFLLAVVPAVLACAYYARRRTIKDARLALPQAGERIRSRSFWVVLDRIVPWVRALILVLLVGAIARPQAGSSIESVSSFGADIVIALDISGSMKAEDFKPDNRLAVAKQTVRDFVQSRTADRLGLVVFATQAATRCPLTLDHEMLEQFLANVVIAPEDQQQTAIGLGLATAVNRLRDSDARSRVVVLLTDGQNNAGQVGPEAVAEAARVLGVKVYTIGVGSDGPVPFPLPVGGGRVEYIEATFELDEELLSGIAATTGGEYFRADDAEALSKILQRIDELEKTEIQSDVRVIYSEVFHWLLVPALLLLMLERFLLSTRLRRIP